MQLNFFIRHCEEQRDESIPRNSGDFQKLLRIVKLTAIILLAALLQVSAKGLTQTVSLSVKEERLDKVFAAIKKQTGYSFFYTDDQLQKARRVTVRLNNVQLQQALDAVFAEQPFSYQVIDKMIVIKQKDPSTSTVLPKENATDEAPLLDISGKVTDADGNPLQGATVKVKGGSKVTTTNKEGVFVLKGVDNDATLEISFVGYQPYTVSVNNKSSITASLKLNVITNPEVIINKGFYTEKQKTSVSNVGKVTADEIEKQPVQNVLLALTARVPGLFVTQGSGNAGGSVKVRIQGQNSLTNGSDPLFIVDGVPIDANLAPTGIDNVLSNGDWTGNGWGNPLNYLNPLDIESVEVLKDADATAIYGSRAANGAILITTKKGKAGAMKLDLNMETGWGRMNRRVDMMNTRQYLDMRYEAFANDGIDWRQPNVSANDLKVWDTTRYTNWQDLLLGGTARYNNINASVSGGSPNMRYLVSGTYHKETTIWPLAKDFADQKAAVHFNLDANNNNQKLHMQFSGNYMFDDNQLPSEDMTRVALLKEPDAPSIWNADGTLNWAPDANGNTTLGRSNPMTQQYLKYVNKTHNLLSNLKLDYALLRGLNIGISFGYNDMQTNDFSPNPLIALAPELQAANQRSAAFGDRKIQSWIINPQASYRTQINKGTLDLLIGGEFQDRKSQSSYIIGKGQLSDELLENLNSAATITKGSNSESQYLYNAFFGRANYNWKDKYILSTNIRRDGSSRFGADNRFHNFGSIGAAWLFSNEDFIKSGKSCESWLSFGKLRGSYGTTGSDQIGDYRFMSLYGYTINSVPYQGVPGLVPAGSPNPELEWEETRKLQIGIDLGFLHDKLVLNANYVRNRSSNQLLAAPIPTQAGVSSYLVNFPATIQNQNWEIMATGKIVQKRNFTWTSSINITIPQNRLLEFPVLPDSSLYWKVGEPIDARPRLHWLGVAEGTGDYLFLDNDGHPTMSPDLNKDRNVWTSTFPKFYCGIRNSISYKGIQFDFLFQFVEQKGRNDIAIWNGYFRYPGMFDAGASNQPTTLLDRWQKPGDNNKSVAKYSTYVVSQVLESDRLYTNIFYVSLKNVSLSWDLPKTWVNKAHFRNFRIYMNAQNLMMLSKYKGLNPETQSMFALPPLQVWTMGVQVGL